MSKYRRIETQFKDEAALRQALQDAAERLGIEFEEAIDGANSLPLYGVGGDLRPEMAQFVIRRWHVGVAANDLGFAGRNDGTYELIISDFDAPRRATLVNTIKQRYAYHQTLALALSQGYTVTEDVAPNGAIRLQLARAY